jgi:tight adherence protein B
MQWLSNLFGNLLVIFVVLAFVAVVLLVEGFYLWWTAYKGPQAKRIEQRLRAMSAGTGARAETSILKNRLLSEAPFLERILLSVPRSHNLDRLIQQSGTGWSISKLGGLSIAFFAITFFCVHLIPILHWAIDVVIALAAATLPFLYILRKRAKRVRNLEKQLPDALDLMARALKAGHALASALQMVGDEAQDPIASEFRIVHDEINYGVSVETALMNLASRVPSTDMRYFVVAVLIQRETGGNLTEVLGNLSALIRERLRLLGKVQVLSAEGRMSGWVMGCLPFAVAAIINLINPGFMSVLWTDPMGLKIVYGMLFLMAMGGLWMRKIIRIRV